MWQKKRIFFEINIQTRIRNCLLNLKRRGKKRQATGVKFNLATTKLMGETKREDHIFRGLVRLGELFANFLLGNVSTTRMDDIHNHLLTLKKRVGNKLARSNSCRISL